MDSISEDKFCDKCSKKVWDFTDKTDSQISKIIETNNDICARIVSSCNKCTKVTASIILITGASIFNYMNAQSGIEDHFFRIVSTKNNENGYFSFKVPDELLGKENLVYFNFENRTSESNIPANPNIPARFRYGSRQLYLKKEDLRTDRVYTIPEGKIAKMGAIEIDPKPTYDYYYFNGEKITKEQFNTIFIKNPKYPKVILSDYEAKIVLNKEDIKNLYLLYFN